MKTQKKKLTEKKDLSNEIRHLGVLIERVDNKVESEVRHLGVLIEHVDDKVGLVAEQYGDIKKTLDAHMEILDSHTEMIASLAVNVEIMKTDIEFIKNSVKKKVDADEFSALERRVILLEKKLNCKV